MKTTLLIDGDEYLFKACAVCEREVKWDDWNHVLYCNEREAWENFERLIRQLRERFEPCDTVLCWSGARPYFRHLLFPNYKGGRPGRKPLCYTDLREMSEKSYVCRSVDGLEADDVMGILATEPWADWEAPRRIIISQDKDMLTVPSFLYREGQLTSISHADALANLYRQTLTGDHVDGYPGCPGMGAVTAEKWLASPSKPGEPWSWTRVEAAFLKAGLTEQDALLQSRLAKILTWSDWDYEKKEPILWTPTS